MRRRVFLNRAGLAGISSLVVFERAASIRAAAATQVAGKDSTPPSGLSSDTVRVWHFHDLWRFDQFDSLTLKQGAPRWRPDATFAEPNIGPLAAWPTVQHDPNAGRWRMWYSAAWKPLRIMVADSDDGLHWTPVRADHIVPAGKKIAVNHVFTLPGGSGGSVYVDPTVTDGFQYKLFVHQRGDDVTRIARGDADHRWHDIAHRRGTTKYLVDDFTLVSKDGLNWNERRDLRWSAQDWHPEPPIFGFYNRHTNRHVMTVRPGWGDRRQCIQSTQDFRDWSGPALVMQPDAMDRELIEFYGMPVFPYGDGYVGLPWVFHPQSTEPNRGFNRFVGAVDCQLAFSDDGMRFSRGVRSTFIGRNAPDEHGGGAIQTSSMVETDDELRFYSAATRLPHGRGSEARKLGMTDNASILLHTLRRDGLMRVESSGDWGRFISRPLVLLSEAIEMNASAPTGEVLVQLTDIESRPIEGFTFEDFAVLKHDDQIRFLLSWKNGKLQDLLGKIIRVEIRMRSSRLFALRGLMHFVDAQDRWLIDDGEPLPM
tara:strand:- start:13598 stop:15214 length:1617 start_codon:yes stop_codon:yes gene_type:complete